MGDTLTLIELLLMLLALLWGCGHVAGRSNWHQDEIDAEQFCSDLAPTVRPLPVVSLLIDGEWVGVVGVREIPVLVENVVVDPVSMSTFHAWQGELTLHRERQS